MRVALYTLGCKVNSYETDRIRREFSDRGARIVAFEEKADVYVINTCTVTQMAAKKSRQMLQRARRLSPGALIVAAGCYVDEQAERQILPGIVDLFIRNQDKSRLTDIVYEAISERDLPMISEGDSLPPEDHTRAYLKVQDGCRQFCSYCIIPYVRGPLHSRPLTEAVSEARRMADEGFREIVLTGIHISSYGRRGTFPDPEAESSLAELILAIQGIPGIDRIRLSSMEPGIITDDFVESIRGASKLCPHFHLSLQSGSERILRKMNRHYTPDEFLQALSRLRNWRPDVALTTDLIVGFPEEEEEDFEDSLRFMERAGFSRVHVFKYSVRPGTAAAGRPHQVPEQIKHERSRLAIRKAEELSEAFAGKFLGSTQEVLTETIHPDGSAEGYTAQYLRTLVIPDGQPITPNRLVRVKPERLEYRDGELFLIGGIV
ncbi:MAG: tRNA (N(6)-L-threonylcarbamoyladenosine(37)-C(2))-methylthiotransferase MtaB [Firmicutes bacterium]|nr:tRNA (N(6)-L-threonylcarbamoyladenosine(37)-C(2))-methylthiotransferase MtaB [Bacillota bacterium]